MKKYYKVIGLALMVSMCLIIPCKADITVNLIRSQFMRLSDVPDTVEALPSEALIQLVWSADTSFEVPIEGSIPVQGGQYAGGDYVLWSQSTVVNGGWSSPADFDGSTIYGNSDVGGATIGSGNLYCLVFATSAANIVAGTMYGHSAMVNGPFGDVNNPPFTVPTVDPSPLSASMVLNTTGLTVQAVPEPSTMALLGLGAVLIIARRVRKI